MSGERIKKTVSFLLVICAVIVLLSPVSFAQDIGGTLYFYEGELRKDSQFGAKATDVSGWSASGNTLTLDGFDYHTLSRWALVLPEDTTIILKGDAFINATSAGALYKTAILAYKNLTIKGTGRLTVISWNDSNENYAIVAENLNIAENAEVDVYTTTVLSRFFSTAVFVNDTLRVSDKAGFRAMNDCGGIGLSVNNLEMLGGTLSAFGNNSGPGVTDGYGLCVGNRMEISEDAVIYANGQENAVKLNNMPPPWVAMAEYDILMPHVPNPPRAEFYDFGVNGIQAVGLDGNGDPDPLTGVNAVKIFKDASVQVCKLTISYIDGLKRPVGTQVLTVARNTTVTDAYLNPPAGYKLASAYTRNVTQINDADNVSVVRADDNFILEIIYKNLNGVVVGTEEIIAPLDKIITGNDLNIPKGYKLVAEYSKTVTKDESVTVTVTETDKPFVQTIQYRDTKSVLIGAQEMTVIPGDIITNGDLKAPVGYRINYTVSIRVTDGKSPVTVTVIPFADEEQYKNINYINGYTDGTFRPNAPITRAEATSIFYKLFVASNYKPNYSLLTRFTDLRSSHWAYRDIAFAVEWGIMQGYTNNTFRPNANITRAEFVTMLYNLNLTPLDDSLPPVAFTDAANHWAKDAINLLSANGILETYGGGNFNPDKEITRAEVVALINKYLRRSDTWRGSTSFSDVQPNNWSYREIMNAANGTY